MSQQFRTSFSIAQERGAHEHGFEERRAPPDSQAAPRYARSDIPGYRIEKKAAKRQLLARRIPAFMNHLISEPAWPATCSAARARNHRYQNAPWF